MASNAAAVADYEKVKKNGGRIAFLSMENTAGWWIYDDLLVEPFNERGWDVTPRVPWRTFREHDWAQYDVVVVRSPWDYQDDLPLFHAALDYIAARCKVENSVDVMKWNSAKLYLRELAHRGCPILPTAFVATAADGDSQAPSRAVARGLELYPEVVIKPAVSASSFDTFRVTRDELNRPFTFVEEPAVIELRGRETTLPSNDFPTKAAFLDSIFGAGVPCLVQPFLKEIMSEGEYSLFYFNGRLSHAMHKLPKGGDYRVQEEYGAGHERLDLATVSPAIKDCGARALAALPHGVPLYARADIVALPEPLLRPLQAATDAASSVRFEIASESSGGEGCGYALMEVELIEPSLYFNIASEGIINFVDAFCERHENPAV